MYKSVALLSWYRLNHCISLQSTSIIELEYCWFGVKHNTINLSKVLMSIGWDVKWCSVSKLTTNFHAKEIQTRFLRAVRELKAFLHNFTVVMLKNTIQTVNLITDLNSTWWDIVYVTHPYSIELFFSFVLNLIQFDQRNNASIAKMKNDRN